MASEPNLVPEAWSLRALTVALGFAYAPFFVTAPSVLAHVLSVVAGLRHLWGLALLAIASSGAVTFAFLALTVGVRWLPARSRKRLFIFLLAHWLPHNVLLALWGFFQVLSQPGGWID